VDVLWTELLLEAVADDLERVDLVANEPVVVGVYRVIIQEVLASFSLELVNRAVVKALTFQSDENLSFNFHSITACLFRTACLVRTVSAVD